MFCAKLKEVLKLRDEYIKLYGYESLVKDAKRAQEELLKYKQKES